MFGLAGIGRLRALTAHSNNLKLNHSIFFAAFYKDVVLWECCVASVLATRRHANKVRH